MTAYTDRVDLTTRAYADSTNLRARYAIYEFQYPRHDLPAVVVDALRDVPGSILDVGSGHGPYTRALRDTGHDVVAVDLSLGMVREAGPPAVVADASGLPFRSGTFGGAAALHMLYHVADPAATIAEITRVVRPDGIVLISTNALDDKLEMRELHADVAREGGFAAPDYGFGMRFHLDDAERLARGRFVSVERIDLASTIEVRRPEPLVAYIASAASWYDGTSEILTTLHARIEAVIAVDGAVRIRSHTGFLVCREPVG